MGKRRIHHGTEVEVSRTISIDVLVKCRVSGGEPERPRTLNGPGEPGSAPEVEILSIESEEGASLNGLIDELSKDDVESIEEKALEEARDQEIAAAEAAAEARAESRAEYRRERALGVD